MSRRLSDRRHDTSLSEHINQGIRIARIDGIGRALDFMLMAGVARAIALRVLSAPELQRRRDRRRLNSGALA
jgi:hypothetical protein